MSGFEQERQAIEERLASNYTALPIRFENAPFRETSTAYCALFIRRGEGRQVTLGDGAQHHRWTGLIIVQVFYPEDTGTAAALQQATTIGDIFRRQEFSVSGSGLIRCRVPSIETVGVRNGWFQVNITTPYLRDKLV